MKKDKQLHPGESALVAVGLLFLPFIPAYLWVWPKLAGTPLQIANILGYLYVLAGTLLIGLRRWNLDQLGINRKGLWTSLIFGSFVILGRSLVVLSIDWNLPAPRLGLLSLAGNFIFYFAVVGLIEEMIARGLIYRALEDWLGTRWAIWGSSLAFALAHIYNGGPLVGATIILYGLIFALIRWRAGGIVGLILVHGAIDFLAKLMLPDLDVLALGRPEISYPAGILLGLALILLTPLLLWQLDWLKSHFPFGSMRHPA
jgi:membrane protease YdiL (CAAX protease family)